MEETQTAVFDCGREVEMTIRTAAGAKTVKVRFPKDEEWIDRQRRRKVVIKQLGRGVSETTIPHGERADEELLNKIRIGEGPELDAFEAAKIIEELSTADVDDVTLDAAGFRVALRVPGGSTAVVVSVPTAKDVFEYRRSFARILDMPFGKQELTVNLGAAATLFGRIVKGTEGYAGDKVPVVHQTAVVKAALEALDSGLQDNEEKPENF
jgi:hypothetical protein